MQLRCLLSLVFFSLIFTACSAKKKEISEEEIWRQASKPSAAHQVLRSLTGKWETRSMYWAHPGAVQSVSRGEAEVRSLYEGRFIQEDLSGRILGRPFQGLGIMGHDNIRNRYTSFWIDSLGTTMSFAEGTYDPARKIFEFRGSFVDPVTRKTTPTRSVVSVPDRHLHRLEVFVPQGKSKEFKTLDVEYTRVVDTVLQ
jgi:hypothetical protein